MSVTPAFQQDVFRPILFSSPALDVTDEQKKWIKRVLELGASDSQFAQKIADAITYILTAGITIPPLLGSLTPDSVTLGSPSFDIHVIGSGFTPESKIIFAGQEEPTTFISPTEITTGINMAVWLGPDTVPVLVMNANGLISNELSFTFLP